MIAVAIDGPAGAGKSTIARRAAAETGFIYVDTGALYRTISLSVLREKIALDNIEGIEAQLKNIDISLQFIDGEQHVFLNGEDVSGDIRTAEVSMATSKVSAIPAVRAFLLDLQKDIAAKNNIIMDGRDIGTVVLPNAEIKLFLTATAEERARRRCKEMLEKGDICSFEDVLSDIQQRDYNDMNRPIAPLKQAVDAELIDSSDMTPEEAVEAVVSRIKNYQNK